MRLGTILTFAASAVALQAIAGCSMAPAVQSGAMPLQRVVVYRNGVGYFERGGRVSADHVDFKVRANEVSDFLASLAVMEAGGSSVRSAAFPIHVDREGDEPLPTCEECNVPGKAQLPAVKPYDPNRLEKVVLSLDGHEHDLQIGYVAVTPVWRPSYRLVVRGDTVELQAWGIVQNISGEDWNSVSLTLVAGAPLAFESTLGVPITPDRPRVSDTGEVIAVVPQTETSLAQQPPPPPSPMPMAAPSEPPRRMEPVGSAAYREGRKKNAPGGKGGAARGPAEKKVRVAANAPKSAATGGYYSPAAMDEESDNTKMIGQLAQEHTIPSAPRNLSALAAIAVDSGLTSYLIPTPVTVPNDSATMVMLLSKPVPGELAFLFAPDPGVPESSSHPFRVARFSNATGGTLERGPLAIFDSGAFLGQGMVDQLPPAASAVVPFALERSLALDFNTRYSEEGARVSKIEAGELTIERDSVTKTQYKVRNGSDKAAHVLIKHRRISGSKLIDPPKGTEDNVGTGSALVPVDVAVHATSDLVVDERIPRIRRVDWMENLADEAIKNLFADPKAPAAMVAKLKDAWQIRETIVQMLHENAALSQEESLLTQNAEQTRADLKAIEKNKAAADLRTKLTNHLGELSGRLDQISKRLIELNMALKERQIRFNDAIRDIKFVAESLR